MKEDQSASSAPTIPFPSSDGSNHHQARSCSGGSPATHVMVHLSKSTEMRPERPSVRRRSAHMTTSNAKPCGRRHLCAKVWELEGIGFRVQGNCGLRGEVAQPQRGKPC